MRMLLVLVGLLAVPVTGLAQDKVLKSGVAECVAANVASRAPIAACLQDAQAACGQYPGDDAQTVDCYVAAKAEWGDLIKDLLENDRKPSAKFVTHIDRCLSCLSCMTTCPSGVKLSEKNKLLAGMILLSIISFNSSC